MKSSTYLRTVFARLLVGTLVAFVSSLAIAADDAINSADKSFVLKAYEDGLADIHVAGLGVEKTANPAVKAFAEKLEADHGKVIGELKTLADAKKVSVPARQDVVDKAKEMMLNAKTGGNFDKAFVDDMVSDHKKAIEQFEKAANGAKDPDVKAFAHKALPTLKAHLSAAEDLQAKLGK